LRLPLDCERIEQDLLLLLDGALDALRAEAVRAHFNECAPCARFYRSLREQIVLHQWAYGAPFEAESPFDPAEDFDSGDLPDFDALLDRVRTADLAGLGTLLYEVLKAEFLYDYGDNVEAESAPIDDPAAERRRGSDMVDELRDYLDNDEVDGIDLRDVAEDFEPQGIDHDRLRQLIEGMEAVKRLAPVLHQPAVYYQALAHMKARRESEASRLLRGVTREAEPGLARFARVTMATLPALLGGRWAESIPLLEACIAGDGLDGLVWFNLAKARFLDAGGQLTAPARYAMERALELDRLFVERQLSRPSERALRRAFGA